VKFRFESDGTKAAIWSGVALITLHVVDKVFWLLVPTGLLSANSFVNGWQLPKVSKNLAFFRDMTSEVLKVPTWYLEYGFFYGIISAVAWSFVAIQLARRKSYALQALLIFSAFSVIHSIAISFAVPSGDAPFSWKTVVFYVVLAIIFTRPAVRAQYEQRHV
jgi:hypothetical protein